MSLKDISTGRITFRSAAGPASWHCALLNARGEWPTPTDMRRHHPLVVSFVLNRRITAVDASIYNPSTSKTSAGKNRFSNAKSSQG